MVKDKKGMRLVSSSHVIKVNGNREGKIGEKDRGHVTVTVRM
jgi:hypothetical protein